MRALWVLDQGVGSSVIAGRSVTEHLRAHLASARFDVVDVDAVAEADGHLALWVLGPWIGVLPASWARLALPGDALVSPDGRLIGGIARSPQDLVGGWPVTEEEAHLPGSVAGEMALTRTLGRRHAWALAQRGARIVDPDRVTLDVTVNMEAGATLWPDTVVLGTTVVRRGAEVRSGCWIEDSEIGENALIKPHCVLESARVGPGSQVGPMAHLRPGSVLVADNKVGNFVEVKAATLARGAKASHLTYLGDAEIGEDANIGAGTITCNYDGHRKHRTRIGARAFIGSNTALVAPIRVGDGAIVGAGSTLTRDVPDDALAVVRGETRVLPGKGRALNERNARLAAEDRVKPQ